MPPKAQKQNAPKGSKVAIDKTFGMKNKNKSAKVQEKAAVIQQQQARKGLSEADIKKQEAAANAKRIKAEEAARLKAQMELFKPQQAQKVPFGVDPKTVLCQYFAAGFCDKGVKCKFSHDKNIGRKTEKKNLYTDDREGVANPGAVDPNDKKLDTMDTWDDDKLAKVVLSKAGNPKTSTDIVCKFFIQAIEDQKYGWFWECPNGVECKYRHALPPGYVLNSEKKKKEAEAKAKVITLEEFLESERHKLGKNLTPVTAETFATWKKTRLDAKTAQEQTANKLKQQAGAAGKMTGMSGKDLFTFNPDWYNEKDDNEGDDGDAWDLDQYRKDEDGNPIEAERDDDDDDAETTRSGLPPRSEAGTSDAGLERSVAGLSVAGDEPAESQDGATSRDG